MSQERITKPKRKPGRPKKRVITPQEIENARQTFLEARKNGDMRHPMQIYLDLISKG